MARGSIVFSRPFLDCLCHFFSLPALALICWNDSPHIRGTNRMPSASLSLSSLYPHSPPTPSITPQPLSGKSTEPQAKGGAASVVWGQGSMSAIWMSDIITAKNQQRTLSNTLHPHPQRLKLVPFVCFFVEGWKTNLQVQFQKQQKMYQRFSRFSRSGILHLWRKKIFPANIHHLWRTTTDKNQRIDDTFRTFPLPFFPH